MKTSKELFLIFLLLNLFSCGDKQKPKFLINNLQQNNLDFVVDESVLLVDSRSKKSYQYSHLNKSINITPEMIKSNPSEVMRRINSCNHKKLVIYCYGNSCNKAGLVAQHLVYTGLDISVYTAGWQILQNFQTAPP